MNIYQATALIICIASYTRNELNQDLNWFDRGVRQLVDLLFFWLIWWVAS